PRQGPAEQAHRSKARHTAGRRIGSQPRRTSPDATSTAAPSPGGLYKADQERPLPLSAITLRDRLGRLQTVPDDRQRAEAIDRQHCRRSSPHERKLVHSHDACARLSGDGICHTFSETSQNLRWSEQVSRRLLTRGTGVAWLSAKAVAQTADCETS